MAVARLDLNNMCRHPGLYVQIKANLEGYELKLKRWPQDSVTKYSRSEREDPHVVWRDLRRFN